MPFLDDLIARLRLDTVQFDEAQARATAGARKFFQESRQGATAAGPPLNQVSSGYRGAAAAALGASSAIGAFAGTQNRAVAAMQMVNIQAATMADALARTGGAVGGFAMALGRALPILAVIGGAVALAVAAWDALTASSKKAAEAMKAADDAALAYSRTEQGRADAIRNVMAAERDRRNAQIIAELGQEAGIKKIRELARAEAEAVKAAAAEDERRAIRDSIIEAQRVAAVRLAVEQEMGLRDAKGRTREEVEAADVAAAASAARRAAEQKKLVEEHRKAADATDAMRAKVDALVESELALEREREEARRGRAAAGFRGMAGMFEQEVGALAPPTEPFDRGAEAARKMREDLDALNVSMDDFVIRMAAGHDRAQAFAGFMGGAFASAIGGAATAALDVYLGKSVQLVHADKEAARAAKQMELSKGEAARAGARDAIKAIAMQATVKAAFMYAEAAAMFAAGYFGYGPGFAAGSQALIAAAGYTTLAGVAAAATRQIGAVRKTIPAGGGGGGGGGGGVGLDRFGRAGFDRGGGGGDTMVLNVTVGPGASPEDVADATVRQLETWARNRNRRLRIAE